MPERFTNNATTTLNGAINNSTTTVIATSASTFPASGNFRIRIDDEIMLVTAVSTNTFTAIRGYEGSTAASHSDGATLRHGITAGALRAVALTTYNPDTPPNTANSMDDEFDDTSGMSGTVNGLDARWSWRNQGSATTTFTKLGWLTLSSPAQSSNNLRIIEQTLASGDHTLEARLAYEGLVTSGEQHCGIALWDNTNGDGWTFGFLAQTNFGIIIKRWTNVTSGGSADFGTAATGYIRTSTMNFRVIRTGTTIEFWISTDGLGWLRILSITDPIGFNRAGLIISETVNLGNTKLHCDYFRKTA